MCGFVSIYCPNQTTFIPSVIEAMTDEIDHRGPDDYGYAVITKKQQVMWHHEKPGPIAGPGVAMGHRRLSIIDLTSAGRQPFVSKDKRYWMVYNGEVFNYIELKRDLEKIGYNFTTNTDTEVVLYAFQQWGEHCFNRFNGMWSIIIWDSHNQILTASRDRFGIKPLYYTKIGDNWIFASEIKALLKHPDVKKQIRSDAVFRFLWSEQHPSLEKTYFKNIYSLPSASFLKISNGVPEEGKYWALPDYEISENQNDLEKSEELLELLTDSVKIRLRSDVRVGTMLSGGLDSTSIAKIINSLLSDDVAESSSINGIQQAISACYPNMWNDETSRIDEITKILNINVKKVFPLNENIGDTFFDVIRAMEMPYTQSSPHIQYLLMQNAKSLGVKVTINGHAPDEMLGGYPLRHCPLIAAEQFAKFQLSDFKQSLSSMKEIHNIGISEFFYALLFNGFPTIANYLRSAFRYPKKKYFENSCFKQYPTVASRTLDKYTGGHSILDRRLRQEFFCEVLPHILMYEDKMSMAASIESRVPFLDYRIVEFAFSLSDSQKINKGSTKYVLRNAMKNQLPESIVNEKLKLYFSGPIDKWLKGQLKPIVSDLLLKSDSRINEYMNSDKYIPLIERVINSTNYDDWDERLVWRMLVTEAWLNEFA